MKVRLSNFAEGAGMALDAIRSQKLRSGLTILGIVIGVATVMSMASIVHGIRDQIMNTLEVVGPTTFRIIRFLSATPLNADALPREVRALLWSALVFVLVFGALWALSWSGLLGHVGMAPPDGGAMRVAGALTALLVSAVIAVPLALGLGLLRGQAVREAFGGQ